MNEMKNQSSNMVEVVDIQFRPGQKIYYFDPCNLTCKPGDPVIIDTARGPEYGICASGNHTIPQKDVVAPLRPVLRLANMQDKKIAAENQEKERKAYQLCLQQIDELQLDMQLVSVECAFDGSKLLFFFTADERVDFRELVKSLASFFHTRIELRQIGVRDKARMVGGLGICGRPICCASFLDEFQPVSIKMAKTQNLSLNPTKISGTCGRLLCCLKYEQDAYEDLIRTSPKLESFVDTPDGRGTVVEIDLLRQRVKVKMEGPLETTGFYANTDIAVLRSGKAKKNDPPIPPDLAPISGAGKRAQKEQAEEALVLDSIKFRYSEETIAEQQNLSAKENPEEAKEPQKSHSRRRRNHKPKGAAPQAPQAPKPSQKPVQEAPKAAEGSNDGAKKPNKNRHRRRHKKPAGPKPE